MKGNKGGTKRAALMIWENCGVQAEQFSPLYLFFQAKSEPPNGGYLENYTNTLCDIHFENRKMACRGLLTG